MFYIYGFPDLQRTKNSEEHLLQMHAHWLATREFGTNWRDGNEKTGQEAELHLGGLKVQNNNFYLCCAELCKANKKFLRHIFRYIFAFGKSFNNHKIIRPKRRGHNVDVARETPKRLGPHAKKKFS